MKQNEITSPQPSRDCAGGRKGEREGKGRSSVAVRVTLACLPFVAERTDPGEGGRELEREDEI